MAATSDLRAPRRQRRGIVLAMVLFGLGLGAYVALSQLRSAPQGGAAEDRSPLVEAVKARRFDGPVTVRGTGFVRARRSVTLAARISGAVVSIAETFEPGAAVAPEDVLVTLDARPFEAILAQAEADRQAAQAELTFATKQIERTRSLKSQGFAAAERLDELINRRDQARAQIAGLEALIRSRTLDLEFTQIRAPFKGRVVSRAVDPGTVVQIGTEVGQIYATDIFEIPVPLDTRDAALIPALWSGGAESAPGAATKATVTVRYGSGRYRWDASVARAEAQIDGRSRTLGIIVTVEDPDRPGEALDGDAGVPPHLRPGMVAEVTIEGTPLAGQINVPRDALRVGGRIWTVDEAGRLRIRSVRVLDSTAQTVTVVAPDVDDGTSIIISPLVGAVDGLPVRIAEPSRTPGDAP